MRVKKTISAKGIMSGDNIYLTTNQAAKVLNISLSTLKKFIYAGKIRTLKTPGGHHRILKRDLFSIQEGVAGTEGPSASREGKAAEEVSRSFVALLEKHRRFGQGHSTTVADLAVEIAAKLMFTPRQIELVRLSALLHDIGMLNIKEEVLNKPTPLSETDRYIIRTHPVLGEELVSSIKQLEECGQIVRAHHERYDGTGYPDGTSGDKISPEARVIAVAEAYESMTSTHSYQGNPRSEKEAKEELARNSGSQFDPRVTEAFLSK